LVAPGLVAPASVGVPKIRHENGDKFKNGLSKKGVEYF
jgi:hypothetical protein